jgi:hypothetical protein
MFISLGADLYHLIAGSRKNHPYPRLSKSIGLYISVFHIIVTLFHLLLLLQEES